MENKQVSELLSLIKPGSPVAEFDTALEKYFVRTDTFERLIGDEGDIVSGDKGTGKTALFRILKGRFTDYEALNHVEVLSAFNPAGTPIFQRLLDSEEQDENGYIGVWKSYIFMLAGNWLLENFESEKDGKLDELDVLLQRTGLRTLDQKPASLFSRVVAFIRPRSVESSASFTPDGIPVFVNKLAFDVQAPPEETPADYVRYDEALNLLQDCLAETGFTLWIVFDRLDEAFQASPAIERPALRALLRTYLDIQDLGNLRVKLFLRKDLFARIIEGGFVNLTHINARKIPISWEDDDLYALLYRRIIESSEFLSAIGLSLEASPAEVFSSIFPEKVDDTSKRPTTWNWILTRIRDGNDVKSPRNLVDLFIKAISAQKRREAKQPRVWKAGEPLIVGESLKRALAELSFERVEDTLLAEAGESAADIKLFENGKAEYNDATLTNLLGGDAQSTVKNLVRLGFLEKIGQSYKVPMLYRQGLSITQGKAWSPEDVALDDE